MSVVIQQVVGELETVKGHSLLHPLGSAGWRVWVKVHPAGGYDVGPPCHQPGGAVESISDTDEDLTKTMWGFHAAVGLEQHYRPSTQRFSSDPFKDKV